MATDKNKKVIDIAIQGQYDSNHIKNVSDLFIKNVCINYEEKAIKANDVELLNLIRDSLARSQSAKIELEQKFRLG